MYRRPGRATKVLTCFACKRHQPDVDVRHFNLMIAFYGPDRPQGHPTNRGAGSIDLCQDCWLAANAAAAIRRRPKR